MHVEPSGRKAGGKYFGELQASRDGHLTNLSASSPPSAESTKKRKDEDRAGQRHQWSALFGGHAIEQHDDERILQHIVVQAEQNCDQNSGAKRREDSNSLISDYFLLLRPGNPGSDLQS